MTDPSPNPRILSLRHDGACAVCERQLPQRTKAWWYAATKKIVCFECRPEHVPAEETDTGEQPSEADVVTSHTAQPEAVPEIEDASDMSPLFHDGEAGASARREGQRRRDKREKQVHDRHPRLGKLILALSDEPHDVRSWSKGATGEETLGAKLNDLTSERLVVLHDRRIPGSRANIDHIAITPGGVFVIDSKHYSGRVEKRDLGGWFRTDLRLYVGRRDCTKLVLSAEDQGEVVREVLAKLNIDAIPVRPVLCFIGAEWGMFASPVKHGQVLITWPKFLYELLSKEAEVEASVIQDTARHLAERLPRA